LGEKKKTRSYYRGGLTVERARSMKKGEKKERLSAPKKNKTGEGGDKERPYHTRLDML